MVKMRFSTRFCLLWLVIVWWWSPVPAQENSPPSTLAGPDLTLARHADQCAVGIYCQKDGYSSYYGTGAAISADGYVLTSTTVVPPGATDIQVMFANFVKREGKIVETNETLETTILKVDATDLPFLPLAKEIPAVGSVAYTLSNAHNVVRLNGHASFSRGHVSGVYEVPNQGGESVYAGLAIETTAAVNPGSDGGPILNGSGQICAIISLNVSPLRWQGVGVPTKVLLDQLETFRSGKIGLSFEPVTGVSSPDDPMVRVAAETANSLVGISVKRKYPAEILPRVPWLNYRRGISDWDKLEAAERTRRLSSYFDTLRLIEVNQMLRRPPGWVTGVVVSPDGLVMTSRFNVGDDYVYLPKSSESPVTFEFKDPLDQLLKAPEGGFREVPNTIEKITVRLANGSELEAQQLAQHVPLGIALLKVSGESLTYLDLAQRAAPPQLGDSVALLGYVTGAGTNYTLNSGIVSAANRNRGFQFQTDALLNYGNSGGPVITAEGKLLGFASTPIEPRTLIGKLFTNQELVAWSVAPNSGVGMISRSDRILEALADLRGGKSVSQIPGPFLGIGPDPNKLFSPEVVVGGVAPKSPADSAGLKRGDQLLSLNGEELHSWRDLTDHLLMYKPGDKVAFVVKRASPARKLVIQGQEVATEAQLQTLLKSLKPSEKFEGTMVEEATQTVSVVLGERT